MSKPVDSYGDNNPILPNASSAPLNRSKPLSVLESTILNTFPQKSDIRPLQFVFNFNPKPIAISLDSPTRIQEIQLPSSSMKDFLDDFYNNLIAETSEERSPIAAMATSEAFKARCEKLIHQVQTIYFPTPANTTLENFILSLEQKRQFIQIFYALLEEDLMSEKQAYIYSGLCLLIDQSNQ